jgi:hypothetical protein
MLTCGDSPASRETHKTDYIWCFNVMGHFGNSEATDHEYQACLRFAYDTTEVKAGLGTREMSSEKVIELYTDGWNRAKSFTSRRAMSRLCMWWCTSQDHDLAYSMLLFSIISLRSRLLKCPSPHITHVCMLISTDLVYRAVRGWYQLHRSQQPSSTC